MISCLEALKTLDISHSAAKLIIRYSAEEYIFMISNFQNDKKINVRQWPDPPKPLSNSLLLMNIKGGMFRSVPQPKGD